MLLRIKSYVRTVTAVWHKLNPSLRLSLNTTEAIVFSCRLCFLRAFSFISLIKDFSEICLNSETGTNIYKCIIINVTYKGLWPETTYLFIFCLTLQRNVTIMLLQGDKKPTFRCNGNGTYCCPWLGGRETSRTRLAEVRFHNAIVVKLPRNTGHTSFGDRVVSLTQIAPVWWKQRIKTDIYSTSCACTCKRWTDYKTLTKLQ